jgi:anti-sigma regulatory factor (Ser/Thr protein kinase)
VRSLLSALAEELDLSAELLNDLKTAVSEACNNVVLHAYDGEVGPLIVSLACTPTRVDVLVEDRGEGIRQIAAAEDRMGVGLAVISALATRAEFQSSHGGGTEVRMSFDRSDGRHLDDLGSSLRERQSDLPGGDVAAGTATPGITGPTVLWMAPVSLLPVVLGRVCRAVAASSHFSVARWADLYEISDALGIYATRAAAGRRLGLSIESSPRSLTLTAGPFLSLDGAAPNGAGSPDAEASKVALEALVDELTTERARGYDLLHICVSDRRPGPVTPGA